MTLSKRIEALERAFGVHQPLVYFADTEHDDMAEHADDIDRARKTGRVVLLVTQANGVFRLLPDGTPARMV
ncbi:hypothetical protein ACNQFN_14820 [Thauera butanivorans]|uniref:hypothetical protein n=1 Tax=Thauera butanivorans TaxID=86174 RepID=UPI003AB81E35